MQPNHFAEARRQDRAWSPYRRALGPLSAIVEEARSDAEKCEEHYSPRKRSRRPADNETFRLAIEALIADLAHRVLTAGSGGRVHLSLSNNYLSGAPRYRAASVGASLKLAIELLSQDDTGPWLRVHPPLQRGEQTMLAAGPRLLHRLRDCRVAPPHIVSKFDTEEVVLLRAEREDNEAGIWSVERPSRLVDYKDSELTIRLRNEVRSINESLHRLSVQVISGDGLGVRKLDMPSVFLRRSFTRGSFDNGGRLWDATGAAEWYSLRKATRLASLVIEGDPAAEADIKAASLSILYAIAGEPLPEGDLYTPPGYGLEHRATFKLAAQCAAFRFGPYRRWPEPDKDPEKHPVLPAAEAFGALEAYHAPIRRMFWKGLGHRTQRLESDVLVRTLVTRPDLCGLPLHDALFVPESLASDAANVLMQSFREVTGGECRVSIKRAP
jgi:hypothetical protein